VTFEKELEQGRKSLRKQPGWTIIALILVVGCLCYYWYSQTHKPQPPPQNSAQCTGDQIQCAGTNNGTMEQNNH
jgi:uncharacterized membrane protein